MSIGLIDGNWKTTAEVDAVVAKQGDGRFTAFFESVARTRDEALKKLNLLTTQGFEDFGGAAANVVDEAGRLIGSLRFTERLGDQVEVEFRVHEIFERESDGEAGLFSLMSLRLKATPIV